MGGIHQYPMRSGVRENGCYFIEFETNGAGAPDGLVDPGNIVSTVTRTAASTFLVTLRDRWTRIGAMASFEEPDAEICKVTAKVVGHAAANTITVMVVTEALVVAADTNDKTVTLQLQLQR